MKSNWIYVLALTGADVARHLLAQWPACRILMISATEDEQVIVEAIQAGCQGFLPKGRTASAVLEGLRAIHAGEAVFDPGALACAARCP